MRRSLVAILTLAFLVAACGGNQTTTEAAEGLQTDRTPVTPTGTDDEPSDPEDDAMAPDEVVFIWAESGGCAMAGPNCARYEVTAGGDVSTYREGENEVAATGTVDQARVAEWIELAGDTDMEELVARLGPGEMRAAFDGIDIELSAPPAGLKLSSTRVDFADSEPLFVNAAGLAALAAKAAPLEIASR